MKNVAITKYPDFEGTYTLASDKINGRPYWILTDQNATMWYDNNNWIINDQSESSQGLLMNIVEKASCPTMGNWTILDMDTGEWISSPDDVEIKKIGKNLHIHYSLFINKSFALNEMFQQNASKFAIFYV